VARAHKTSKAGSIRQKRLTAAQRDLARTKSIAQKLAKIAPEEDPARVAGAIAIFATETIRRSANNLMQARAYLDGQRAGTDGFLKNAIPETPQKEPRE